MVKRNILKTSSIVEGKLDFFVRNPAISLIIIGIIGVLIRLYYFPYNVPLVLDALNNYFFYASDVSVLHHLPTNFSIDNNGWPIFLSIFFTLFHFDNVLDYMTLQRMLTISLSVLTIIPVYFFCARFLEKPYAICGAALFAFEPHLIQNSLLGLTESLYIFLVSLSLAFFFSSNKKLTYASFGIVALATIVRAEGMFVFIPLIIMFFIRHRKEKRILLRCTFAALIFILILLPMAVFRIQTEGHDALTSRISSGLTHFSTSDTEGSQTSAKSAYLISALENFVKLSGWSLIPVFIFFVPAGVVLVFKNRNYNNTFLIVSIIFMLLPVFYGFSIAPDTRYIYPLFPLFCVLSILFVKRITAKFENQRILMIVIIGGVLLSSTIYLDLKRYDYEHQEEAFGIAKYITSVAKGVNDYYPEDSYIKPAEIPSVWPVLSSTIPSETRIISTSGFTSLTKYLEDSENKGLTHLVTDRNKGRPDMLIDVFNHEEKYPYLIKVFDSSKYGYKYQIKIYKIDYDILKTTIQSRG